VIVQPEFFIPETRPVSGPAREPIPIEKLAELAESLGDSPLKTTLQTITSRRKRALTNKQKSG
jgi:hypothetical protein